MITPLPKSITVEDGEQELVIEWADRHVSRYSLDGLRQACPCAVCAGGHEFMGQLPDPSVFTRPSLTLWKKVRIEPVGTYAIRIEWDDGHNTGIYTWERLRLMCPCDICYPKGMLG